MRATENRDERFLPVVDGRPQDAPWPPLRWPVDDSVLLTGRTVELVPVVPHRDAADLFAALDHEQVWQHFTRRPRTALAVEELLEHQLATGALPWLVRLRLPCAGLPAGAVVGTSSYLDVSVPDARLEIGSTAYTPRTWGTAVNPDTKLVLLSHAFEVFGAGRVQLKTDVRNTRSQEAIARLGAQYEGTLRRYQRRADGTVRDTVLFSITAEDWPQLQVRLQVRLDTFSEPQDSP